MNTFLVLMGLTVSEFPFVGFVLAPFLLAFFVLLHLRHHEISVSFGSYYSRASFH